ncbi:MAG: hypothetical protein M5U12_18305 [Verrucomicrobia bacterium]|nr:hypothetical protein [Verrucomicrobiota bacterium]
MLFKDLEPGLVVKAFTFECDLRIGGGHNNPADGFSLNYVRDTDPIVANIEAGIGNPFAGTDSENGYGADSDSGPGTGNGLPEEGCSTGLAIGFDTWQSATINGVQDVVGLSIRVDSKLIAQLPVPLKPGNIFLPTMPNPGAQGGAYEYDPVPYRNLPKSDPNYASSMQTGALSDEDLNGDGVVNAADQTAPQPVFGDPNWGLWVKNLHWEKFKAELTEDGAVKVWWKGVELTPAGGIPTEFTPSPGRIVFAARTGDNFEVHHVDNIVLTTIPADNVIIGNATGSPIGFSVVLIDSGPAVVNPDTIALKLDGTDVTRTSVSKTGGNTTVRFFDVTKPLVPGSVHTVEVTVRDTRGTEVTDTQQFTVPAYVTLPPEYAVAGVSQPGFNFAVHQTATRNQENTIARAEQQLQGLRGANVADLTGFVGGVYAETGVINYSQLGAAGIPEAAGVFQENNGFPDEPIPGIPSATEVNPDGTIYTDNIAAEIVTYLQFPAPGVYNLIFNSDDGFPPPLSGVPGRSSPRCSSAKPTWVAAPRTRFPSFTCRRRDPIRSAPSGLKAAAAPTSSGLRNKPHRRLWHGPSSTTRLAPSKPSARRPPRRRPWSPSRIRSATRATPTCPPSRSSPRCRTAGRRWIRIRSGCSSTAPKSPPPRPGRATSPPPPTGPRSTSRLATMNSRSPSPPTARTTKA